MQAKRLSRALNPYGFVVSITNGNHIRITHKHIRGMVFCPLSPSDHRSMKNVASKIKREFGIKVKVVC